MTILRQQVASYEASEHEAQVLEEVQRSVSRECSAGGNIAEKMRGDSWDTMLGISTCIAAPDHRWCRLLERFSFCLSGRDWFRVCLGGGGSLFQPNSHVELPVLLAQTLCCLGRRQTRVLFMSEICYDMSNSSSHINTNTMQRTR